MGPLLSPGGNRWRKKRTNAVGCERQREDPMRIPRRGPLLFPETFPSQKKSAKAAPEKAVSMQVDSSWPLSRNLLKQQEIDRGYYLGE
jgi:hypothetical protein